MGIEIEKKFTVEKIPFDLKCYPFHAIEQGYLNVRPAIRVRREDDIYYMTYKGAPEDMADVAGKGGGIGQTEYNMPLDKKSYDHLSAKADGNFIVKKRYLIPLNDNAFDEAFLAENEGLSESIKKGDIKIELDIFEGKFKGLILAEVEFPSEEAARAYRAADWFKEDVTGNPKYSNSHMSAQVE